MKQNTNQEFELTKDTPYLSLTSELFRDNFVNAPSQWETTLQCNVWLAGRMRKMIHGYWMSFVRIWENIYHAITLKTKDIN